MYIFIIHLIIVNSDINNKAEFSCTSVLFATASVENCWTNWSDILMTDAAATLVIIFLKLD